MDDRFLPVLFESIKSKKLQSYMLKVYTVFLISLIIIILGAGGVYSILSSV